MSVSQWGCGGSGSRGAPWPSVCRSQVRLRIPGALEPMLCPQLLLASARCNFGELCPCSAAGLNLGPRPLPLPPCPPALQPPEHAGFPGTSSLSRWARSIDPSHSSHGVCPVLSPVRLVWLCLWTYFYKLCLSLNSEMLIIIKFVRCLLN